MLWVRACALLLRTSSSTSAILNDWKRMEEDRRLAWSAYVGATQTTIDAANDVGASYVVVSTDWVFDGTQGGADESTPPNPVNLYGVLKLASEITALERGGAVAASLGCQRRPSGASRNAACTGPWLWLLRCIGGRRPARRTSVRRLGGGTHQHAGDSIARERVCPAHSRDRRAAVGRDLPLLRR